MAPDQITDFWFRDDVNDAAAMHARIDTLFSVDAGFDAEVRARLCKAVERAFAGTLDHWAAEPHGALALVILLDQAPRNIYRGTACAFTGDVRARAITDAALAHGFEAKLALIECVFLYLPFEHAEDLTLQNRCVSGYEALHARASKDFLDLMAEVVQAGEDHREVIRRFGRFPHRNALLGRTSTPDERAWLEVNRGGWGQGAAELDGES